MQLLSHQDLHCLVGGGLTKRRLHRLQAEVVQIKIHTEFIFYFFKLHCAFWARTHDSAFATAASKPQAGDRDARPHPHSCRSHQSSTPAKEDTVPIYCYFSFLSLTKVIITGWTDLFFSPHEVQLPHVGESITAALRLDEFLLYMEMYENERIAQTRSSSIVLFCGSHFSRGGQPCVKGESPSKYLVNAWKWETNSAVQSHHLTSNTHSKKKTNHQTPNSFSNEPSLAPETGRNRNAGKLAEIFLQFY